MSLIVFRTIYSCADLTHQLEFHESAALDTCDLCPARPGQVTGLQSRRSAVYLPRDNPCPQSRRPGVHLPRDKHPLAILDPISAVNTLWAPAHRVHRPRPRSRKWPHVSSQGIHRAFKFSHIPPKIAAVLWTPNRGVAWS